MIALTSSVPRCVCATLMYAKLSELHQTGLLSRTAGPKELDALTIGRFAVYTETKGRQGEID